MISIHSKRKTTYVVEILVDEIEKSHTVPCPVNIEHVCVEFLVKKSPTTNVM